MSKSMTKDFKRDGNLYDYHSMQKIIFSEVEHLKKVRTGRKAKAIKLSNVYDAKNILDVGTETGTLLLALDELSSEISIFWGRCQ